MPLHEITLIERREIQRTLLHMLVDLKYVCDKHKITFMLGGGSALGAVRHKGFIPWDDDLDVNMPRKDYEKFKKIFKDEMGDKYDISAPNTENVVYPFMKIYKKGTVFKEAFADLSCNGLRIDIFPIDYTPNNGVIRYTKGLCANFIHFLGASLFIGQHNTISTKFIYNKNILHKFRYYIAVILARIFPVSFVIIYNLYDRFVQGKRSENMTIPTGRKYYNGEHMSEVTFLPVRMVKFEGYDMPIVGKAEDYLSNLYGDYMMIPPVEKREKHLVEKFAISEDVSWITHKVV